jgi:hypothetical protein
LFNEKTAQISEHRGDKADDGLLRIEYQFEAEKPEVKYTTTYHFDQHFGHGWGYWHYPVFGGGPVWMNGNPHGTPRSATKASEDMTFNCSLDWDSSMPISSNSAHDLRNKKTSDTGNHDLRSSTTKGDSRGRDENLGECLTSMHISGAGPSGSNVKGFTKSVEAKDGITVKGSNSNQTFRYGSIGTLETNKHVLVIQLKGHVPSLNKVGGEIIDGLKRNQDLLDRVQKPLSVRDKIACETCGKRSKSSAKFCGNCGTALV